MVNSLIYCSEQIAIPETFPNILKNYAKAAIRTQPYDLLRWSATYFRCLARDEPPPAKCRLEQDIQCGALTKGYLRVLLDQVGKGFFISRQVLQEKWEGLCLPQDDLLKYLSVTRMLNWNQIHWLKLFGIMVGSINETPRATMTMLCELLTEDVEGGPARVPMWMFRTVYTFVAELDCSEEQMFINGRKKLDNGQLEPERQMDATPKVFSTTSLKQNIMNECLARYNEEYQTDQTSRILALQAHKDTDSAKSDSSQSSESSALSSGFQFFGKSGNGKQIIQKCGDFDSLILLLRETQGAKLHEYKGPHNITRANIEHAKRREAAVEAEREKQETQQDENTKKYLHLERMNILREVGPPWSWIHQFVNNNCMNMSYNFIEEGSVASDVTPPESSDESFDFRKEKPISSEDSETDSHLFSTTTDNPEDLIKDEKLALGTDKNTNEGLLLQNMNNKLTEKDSRENIDLSDVSSIVSFINKDEMGVLLRGGERAAPNFSIEILDQILRSAMQNGVVFESIDEVMDFVKEKYEDFIRDTQTEYFVKSGYYKALQTGEKIVSDEVCAEEISADESVATVVKKESKISVPVEVRSKASDGSKAEKPDTQPPVEKSETTVAADQEDKGSSAEDDAKTSRSGDTVATELKKTQTVPTLENIAALSQIPSDPVDIGEIGGIENVFDSCGMETDPKLLAKKISDTMILGLAEKHPQVQEAEEEVIPSTLDDTENPESAGGYVSDFSNDTLTTVTNDQRSSRAEFICGLDVATMQAREKKPDIECYVPPYPGIGRAFSKKTIQDFLTYLKFRSRSQKGMVCPRNFREDKCPEMFN